MVSLIRQTLITVALLALWGCADPPAPTPPAAPAPAALAAPPPAPLVPSDPGRFTPSRVSLSGEAPLGALLVDSNACAACHPSQTIEWSSSTHALSSFSNPLYRVAFDSFVEARGREAAPFCGGCHDPALLLTWGMDTDIQPDDPRSHAGVGCGLCHGVSAATAEGNASYTLDSADIPLPVATGKGIYEATSLAAHLNRVQSAAQLSNALCMSCHRGFVDQNTGHPTHLTGLDEAGDWRRSGYAGNRARRIDTVQPGGCISCHMPARAGGGSDHRFAGGHTSLAAMTGDAAQLAATQAQVRGAASLYVVPLEMHPEGPRAMSAPWSLAAARGEVRFDVVVFNEAVGHRLPGGALDLRDTWIEVEIRGADGALLASAGAAHEASGADPSAHRLQALVTDDKGLAVTDHGVAHFRTPVFNHTLTPRAAAVARYVWRAEALPAQAWPLQLRATLKHRRIQAGFYAASCAASQTELGVAFAEGAATSRGVTLDGCAPQPVTEMASAQVSLGPEGPAEPLGWLALGRHGRGLERQVQERLGEAIWSLQASLAALPEGQTQEAAALHVELARVLGHQGRTDDALRALDEAQALVGQHPAIDLVRGQALSQVWRWPAAAQAWEQASQGAVGDDEVWAGLAVARGSAAQPEAALAAAQQGLALEPRSAALLRSQMVALQKLAPGSAEAAQAAEGWAAYRRDEAAPSIRASCSDASEDCLRRKAPVPVYELVTSAAPP